MPLFTINDPPQNMLTLLDNLPTLQSKTEKGVFRERAYSVFFSSSNKVQERALNALPNLCETVDYAEVSNVLFPRVAVRTFTVFSSTTFEFYRSLSSWFSPKLGYFPSKSPHLQLS
jgi:hypothetical protein